ncbi:hypothetical protein [Acetoanaerobium noterae]|uniref:hypothetical protein n=1 Tax=Acetoanaerobium noterae TaxID=745369 RepID=UPI003242AC76
MANKKFELQIVPVTKSDYEKPQKDNLLVAEEKYQKIDNACENNVVLANTGVVYVEDKGFQKLFGTNDPDDADYIFENQIPEKDKKTFGNQEYAHSSAVVGLLDKKAQEVRDAEKQALLRYGRNSIININDSPVAEKSRRQFDSFANKEIKKLRGQRGGEYDEITGDPLEPNHEFHHNNKKAIHTDPEDLIDPDGGKNVNRETHKEIHRQKIVDEKQLEAKREDIIKKVKTNKG